MILRGHMKNGVVILDDPTAIPDGAEVRVEVLTRRADGPTNGLLEMLDFVGDAGMTDLSTNLDHYLYGHPKVDDAK